MMASIDKPERILIIVQNLPVPFDRRVWLEATTLAENGYEVSVICPKAKGFNASFETLENVDIYRYSLPIDAQGKLGFIIEFSWCFVRTALKTLQVTFLGKGFDAIQACNPPETYWLLGWAWGFFGKKFIFDHHDLSPEMYTVKFGKQSGLLHDALLMLERMTFRTASIVITTNHSHKEIAVKRGEKSPDDIFVVRSAPDLKRFTIYPVDQTWKKDKKYLIAFLGEMCKQDGVDHLIRAIKILLEDFQINCFHCVFIGGGPQQEKLKHYAEELEVMEHCTFTGRVSDKMLCQILSSTDIGIDPSPNNTWSDKSTMNKIMEYMFFGLPIVAYDLTENKISAGESAIYAQANSEKSLAQCIAKLFHDPSKREAMSTYGYKKFREQLAWEHSIPHLLAGYRKIFSQENPQTLLQQNQQ